MKLVSSYYTGQGHHFKKQELYTFAVLRMLGNIDLMILANNETGLLSSFFNSFKKLLALLPGPDRFLTFSELIMDVTSSLFVALNVKVFSTGSERQFLV